MAVPPLPEAQEFSPILASAQPARRASHIVADTPQQEKSLFAEQVCQPGCPPPRRPPAGIIGGEPAFDHIAVMLAQREKVADRAGMDVRRLVPRPVPGRR